MVVDPRLDRPEWRGRTNVDALTIACLEAAERAAGHEFVVTQGSYQAGAGDPGSEGTHDGGGVVDLQPCHPACIRHLRAAGMFAWWRTSDQGLWPPHIHAGVLDHPALAPAARRQQDAYLAGRNGLANNRPDDGPRLNPIPRPVWPPQEEDMPLTPEDVEKVAAAVLATPITVTNPVTKKKRRPSVAQLLRELWQRQAAEQEEA